jgi:hypothetical protein
MRRLASSLLASAFLVGVECPSVAGPVATPNATIPFALVRNKALIPVRVQGSRPLRLILDSGMGFEGVLLFDPAMRDSLGGARLTEAAIAGAGGGAPSRAYFADSMVLRIGDVRIGGQRVIVLGDSAMLGGTSDGVIGYTLLGRYAVQLDYSRLALTLHEPRSYRRPPGWSTLPLTLNDRNWPFLQVAVAVEDETPQSLQVYIDCASSETIEILTRPGMTLREPSRTSDVTLGRGLSGDIRGWRGRLSRLLIGTHELRDIEAAFVPATVRSKAKGADAVLANGALSRFDVVFDYAHRRLHLRPNGRPPQPLD